MSVPSKWVTANDTVLFSNHSSPYLYRIENKKRENNKLQNWAGPRVKKILFREWEHRPMCF